MSKDRPTRLERLALEIPCPHCAAQTTVWCVRSHGWSVKLHAARMRPTERIFRAGYRLGAKEAS